MRFSENELLSLDQEEFCAIFTNKHVRVLINDGSEIQGFITKICLAANINPDTRDHLPIIITINSKNINIFKIKSIELI